jgi:hypothetical protein
MDRRHPAADWLGRALRELAVNLAAKLATLLARWALLNGLFKRRYSGASSSRGACPT